MAVPGKAGLLPGRVFAIKKSRHAAAKVLEFYRGRWQIVLVFKRLKSLLDLGHPRKVDPAAARSWIHGKFLVAFLVKALLREGDAFFHWGYLLREGEPTEPMPVA